MLEQVADRAYAEVDKSRVYRWYGVTRLGKASWRDLNTKWVELNENESDENKRLFVAETQGTFVFINGRGLEPTKEAWFQPVENRTE